MTEKRKARILTSYYRPKPGGYCTRLFRGIAALLKAGNEVHYLSVSPFPISHPNCHFHRFPWFIENTDTLLFWALFHIFSPFQLLYLGFRYHITHAFAFGTNYGFTLQLLRLLKKIPTALFLRGDGIKIHRINGKGSWLIRLDTIIEGFAIHGVYLYGVSDNLIKRVINRHHWARPRHIQILRNDIQPTVYNNTRELSTPLHVGCVGILEKRKNQSLLLGAMQDLPTEKIHLHLYGTGPQEATLRKLSYSINVYNKVTFHGWVDSNIIWKQIDLLVFPSLHEGSPNAVLEALANKVPIMASDIPEHAEILPRSCLLSPNDDKAWAEALQKLLLNPRQSLALLSKEQSEFSESLFFDWNAWFVESVIVQ
ncbi:MAG: glycosyltransferase family 4 protein [Pseudomonadota bacterium]